MKLGTQDTGNCASRNLAGGGRSFPASVAGFGTADLILSGAVSNVQADIPRHTFGPN